MNIADTVFPLLTGLVAGCLGALLGLGGGVVVVPMLELLSERFMSQSVTIQTAIAASQLGVLSVGVASSAGYLLKDVVRVGLAYQLAPFTVFGGLLGSLLGLVLQTRVVALVFAGLLVYVGLELIRGIGRLEHERMGVSPVLRPAVFFAGMVSGLLGIGGGTVQVPALNYLAGLPFRAAVATSTFMMALTAITNVIIYGAAGRFQLVLAAPVAFGILIGARFASGYAARVPVRTLKLMFSMLVLYSAFELFRKHL